MGKRKQLVKELEAALAQMEQDWRIEHENAGLMERNMLRNIAEQVSERKRYAMVVDAMTAGMKRLTEERDEAEKNVAELLRNNETADSVIRDLRRELEGLKRECSAHSLNLLDRLAATQRERDAALGNWQNTESLLQERERELDALQEQHTEMSDELDELRAHSTKTIGDLRYQLQSSQAPVICSRCGRDILAKDDAAPAEPVVTLDAIFEMEEGEKLIDDDGVSIERTSCGYEIIGGARHGKSDFPGGAFSIYHTIKKGAAA